MSADVRDTVGWGGAAWTIPGADGEVIRGQTHAREGLVPRAVCLLGHGFKGYKDYGFLPTLACELARGLPVVVHRFNFSHSGMGDDPATFGREDLFEKDTWNKQVFDLHTLMGAAREGALERTPAGLPVILLGHSRGGASAILASGRAFRDGMGSISPAGVVAMASPSSGMNLSEEDRALLIEQGWLASPSSRTGQMLRIGRVRLEEQLASPEDHEVLTLAGEIGCPMLVAHGDMDRTVPVSCCDEIVGVAQKGERLVIEGGDHVFNTKNPADPDGPRSAQLERLCEGVVGFVGRVAT